MDTDLLLATRDVLLEHGGGRLGTSYEQAPYCVLGALRVAQGLPEQACWNTDLDLHAKRTLAQVARLSGQPHHRSQDEHYQHYAYEIYAFNDDVLAPEFLTTDEARANQLAFLDEAIRLSKDEDSQ